MKLKFKKLHPNAVLPAHAKQGDAGMDLTVTEIETVSSHKIRHKYGVAVEIPEGNVGLIFPRSSIFKTSERLSNAVGVIDSGYRGELMAVFDLPLDVDTIQPLYFEGDRSSQLVIVPFVSCSTSWSEELSETERGASGYGSTNKKEL